MLLSVSGQNEGSVFHEVQPEETKYGISKTYGISIELLEKFNPDIRDGLRPGMKLYIPKADPNEITEKQDTSEYLYITVKPQQTLYSISKDYGVSFEEIKALNPEVEDGLKEGQVLRLPKRNTVSTDPPKREEGFIYHTVKKGETAYSLSKQYEISLDSLYLLNPDTETAIVLGSELKFPKRETQRPKAGLNTDARAQKNDDTKEAYLLYKVKQGDTFFSLDQKLGVSKEELIELNPELTDGLRIGAYIIVPNKANNQEKTWLDQLFSEVGTKQDTLANTVEIESEELVKSDAVDLDTISINYQKRHRVGVMLPFYGLDNSTDLTLEPELEKRSMLALEFYQGLLLAADSLERMGMNLTLDVVDTKNSKVDVEEKIKQFKRNPPELIIGPLYKNHVEHVAKAMEEEGVLVVSPLSNKVSVEGKPNLIQCITSVDGFAAAVADILNQLEGKNKHIVFAHTGIENELETQKQIRARIQAIDNSVTFAELVGMEDDGYTVDRFAIKDILAPEGENVFVSLTRNKVFLADLVNKLYSARDTSIQLVASSSIMDINTLDYKYLNAINLKMPDDHNLNAENSPFFNALYYETYGVMPSKYALQGYDVGLYFFTRLYQYGPYFEESLKEPAELLYTGFSFKKTKKSGYENTFMFTTVLKEYELVRLK
jgi:LysM repeat protein/ABC-type branched-subunit amino acid transport system substrate-binding protein